ncbi:hypothetical protein PTSG_03170 [Salpingoeca rosetta]|uniref:Myosin motor domain-containing protein n=1 Tax=Salpingoeca rosetta (strain ATCC 50818 / BSB-021) TaxID=946362 RepID=F2U4F4_SALR5|nr:uncharacterized protein PTSG_03170 [Salpingoeca rosetta]EGD82520.1 hypothetical protein PTSG_03170 [Salpingoeca rosetta]|eukprot:XP_004995756.1 hypothetical protein PTSG_03170 [Salpingoeca rosetta]
MADYLEIKGDASAPDNLVSLNNLTEDTIMDALRERYTNDEIYTYVGDILLAINPMKQLAIYNKSHQQRFSVQNESADSKPHIFDVARRVYQNMHVSRRGQCCLISGESGAGKTETTKYFLNQLLRCEDGTNQLEEMILLLNPIFEAFGNARTVLNDNSSRFGKFLEVLYDNEDNLQAMPVVGAQLSKYLLEKSRVTTQAPGESNFHVFYYFLSGVSDERRDELHLKPAHEYNYLNPKRSASARKGGNLAAASKGDMPATVLSESGAKNCADQFAEVLNCLQAIGLTDAERWEIQRILAGVLELGNLTFTSQGSGEDADAFDGHILDPANPECLEAVADVLGISADDLHETIVTTSFTTAGETFTKPKSMVEAFDIRDAIARALYDSLFEYLVKRSNQLLHTRAADKDTCSIGVLDIFGFESFAVNGFEQLCINVANEQLQNFFNSHIFKMELDEYDKEGVKGAVIKYNDNTQQVDLFLKKPVGLLLLLDEASRFARSTAASVKNKFDSHFKDHPLYSPAKKNPECFTIAHYAGSITYNSHGFLERNRDSLPDSAQDVMGESSLALIRSFFKGAGTSSRGAGGASHISPTRANFKHKSKARFSRKHKSRRGSHDHKSSGMKALSFARNLFSRRGKSRKSKKASLKRVQSRMAPTVAAVFRQSLAVLMTKLNARVPYFIRCIKPNREKKAGFFDAKAVREQLTYTGVMETTSIRQCGYPVRLPFKTFFNMYKALDGSATDGEDVKCYKTACQSLLQRANLKDWAMGNTKVFLRYHHSDELAAKLGVMNKHAAHLQACVRGFLSRRKLPALREQAEERKKKAAEANARVGEEGTTVFTPRGSCISLHVDDGDSGNGARLISNGSNLSLLTQKLATSARTPSQSSDLTSKMSRHKRGSSKRGRLHHSKRRSKVTLVNVRQSVRCASRPIKAIWPPRPIAEEEEEEANGGAGGQHKKKPTPALGASIRNLGSGKFKANRALLIKRLEGSTDTEPSRSPPSASSSGAASRRATAEVSPSGHKVRAPEGLGALLASPQRQAPTRAAQMDVLSRLRAGAAAARSTPSISVTSAPPTPTTPTTSLQAHHQPQQQQQAAATLRGMTGRTSSTDDIDDNNDDEEDEEDMMAETTPPAGTTTRTTPPGTRYRRYSCRRQRACGFWPGIGFRSLNPSTTTATPATPSTHCTNNGSTATTATATAIITISSLIVNTISAHTASIVKGATTAAATATSSILVFNINHCTAPSCPQLSSAARGARPLRRPHTPGHVVQGRQRGRICTVAARNGGRNRCCQDTGHNGCVGCLGKQASDAFALIATIDDHITTTSAAAAATTSTA